jgi:hypothetical protein
MAEGGSVRVPRDIAEWFVAQLTAHDGRTDQAYDAADLSLPAFPLTLSVRPDGTVDPAPIDALVHDFAVVGLVLSFAVLEEAVRLGCDRDEILRGAALTMQYAAGR